MDKLIKITLLAVIAVLYCAPADASRQESLSYRGKLPATRLPSMEWGKDPFAPAMKTEAQSPEFKLTAIFFNEKRSSAIIDDRIVYKGSEIKGQKIIDIGRTHVILQGDAGTFRLEIAGVPGVQ